MSVEMFRTEQSLRVELERRNRHDLPLPVAGRDATGTAFLASLDGASFGSRGYSSLWQLDFPVIILRDE